MASSRPARPVLRVQIPNLRQILPVLRTQSSRHTQSGPSPETYAALFCSRRTTSSDDLLQGPQLEADVLRWVGIGLLTEIDNVASTEPEAISRWSLPSPYPALYPGGASLCRCGPGLHLSNQASLILTDERGARIVEFDVTGEPIYAPTPELSPTCSSCWSSGDTPCPSPHSPLPSPQWADEFTMSPDAYSHSSGMSIPSMCTTDSDDFHYPNYRMHPCRPNTLPRPEWADEFTVSPATYSPSSMSSASSSSDKFTSYRLYPRRPQTPTRPQSPPAASPPPASASSVAPLLVKQLDSSTEVFLDHTGQPTGIRYQVKVITEHRSCPSDTLPDPVDETSLLNTNLDVVEHAMSQPASHLSEQTNPFVDDTQWLHSPTPLQQFDLDLDLINETTERDTDNILHNAATAIQDQLYARINHLAELSRNLNSGLAELSTIHAQIQDYLDQELRSWARILLDPHYHRITDPVSDILAEILDMRDVLKEQFSQLIADLTAPTADLLNQTHVDAVLDQVDVWQQRFNDLQAMPGLEDLVHVLGEEECMAVLLGLEAWRMLY